MSKKILYVLVITVLFTSCLSQRRIRLLQTDSYDEIPESFPNKNYDSYELKTGDLLYINIRSVDQKTSRLFNSDMPRHYTSTMKNLNSYKIDKDGNINFSFIDKLNVKGLTVEEAQELVQETINEYFKEATAIVKLVNFRVSVLGEVNDPGTFTVENKQMNVLQAIAKAGGIKTFGDRDEVYLVRKTDSGSNMYTLDITDNKILESDYYYLQPNDVIYVQPMGSKSFAFEKIPYSVLFSLTSIGLTIFTIFN